MIRFIAKCVNNLEEAVIIFFMTLAVSVIFLSIIHRYLSGFDFFWEYLFFINFSWAQELCIYSVIWMAKFGASYCVREGAHIGVDIIVSKVTRYWQKILTNIALLIGFLFTGTIAVLGVRWVAFIFSTGQVSPDLMIPMWIVYLCIPLGSSLMAIRFIQVLASYHLTGMLPGNFQEHSK